VQLCLLLLELMQLVNLSTGQHKAEGHKLPQYVLRTSKKHILVYRSGLVGLSAFPRELPWSWRFRCALDAAKMHH
jgi:hypothetical protein